MQHETYDDNGDPRYHLPRDVPLLTPERASKGDVLTGPDCGDCGATGKDKATKMTCRACRGKGWVGSINVATMDNADIRFAQVQVRNILNYLWGAGIITDDEHTDGHTFQAWRDQHRVALGLQRPVSYESDEPLVLKLRAYGFVLLLKKLNHYDVKAINKAIDVFVNQATELDARREERPYRRAFGNLARVIAPVREQVAYLENLSEEERDLLADERLKILLASIGKKV